MSIQHQLSDSPLESDLAQVDAIDYARVDGPAADNENHTLAGAPAPAPPPDHPSIGATNSPQTNHGDVDETPGDVRAAFVELPTAQPNALPLLALTPPVVSKALMRAYPHVIGLNRFLLLLTWTTDSQWLNIATVLSYALLVQYFEVIVTYTGHLLLVAFAALGAYAWRQIEADAKSKPSLDDVIAALTQTTIKADMLLQPVSSLGLGPHDLRRLLFTTLFLSPIYLIVSFFIITPRSLILCTGIHILTYHSSYLRVTRDIIWRIKAVRLLCFYMTGLDYSEARNTLLFALALAKVQATGREKPAQFTYVVYENQRRWLGIGWTSNLLSYERTPWTDEFLNESRAPRDFILPPPQDHSSWRWVDKTWRVDLTNDGAITLPSLKRLRTTANPGPDEAFIYTDNTWKKPLTEDSYSKYTRRRRWIRTAELVFDKPEHEHVENAVSSGSQRQQTEPAKRNLRFALPDESVTGQTSDITAVSEPASESAEQSDDILQELQQLDHANLLGQVD